VSNELRVDTYTKMTTIHDLLNKLKEFPCKIHFSSSCDDICDERMTIGLPAGEVGRWTIRSTTKKRRRLQRFRILSNFETILKFWINFENIFKFWKHFETLKNFLKFLRNFEISKNFWNFEKVLKFWNFETMIQFW